MFPRYDHTMTPCNGFTIGYTLDNSKCLIAKEILVDLLLPMKGNAGWSMACFGCSSGIHVYLNWRAVHTWQRSMGASVERRGSVSFKEPRLHSLPDFQCAGKW